MIDNRNMDPDRAMLAFVAPVGVRFKRGPIIAPESERFDPANQAWKWLWHGVRVEHCDPHRGRLMEHVRR